MKILEATPAVDVDGLFGGTVPAFFQEIASSWVSIAYWVVVVASILFFVVGIMKAVAARTQGQGVSREVLMPVLLPGGALMVLAIAPSIINQLI
jgi:hypothetical protein